MVRNSFSQRNPGWFSSTVSLAGKLRAVLVSLFAAVTCFGIGWCLRTHCFLLLCSGLGKRDRKLEQIFAHSKPQKNYELGALHCCLKLALLGKPQCLSLSLGGKEGICTAFQTGFEGLLTAMIWSIPHETYGLWAKCHLNSKEIGFQSHILSWLLFHRHSLNPYR